MKISEARKSAAYEAISEPIMKARITLAQSDNALGKKNAEDIDAMLFRLQNAIWRELCQALNISDP